MLGTPFGSLSTIIFEPIVIETTRMVIASVSALGAPWAGRVSRTSPTSAATLMRLTVRLMTAATTLPAARRPIVGWA